MTGVWAGWLLLSALAIGYGWHYGMPMPFADEWGIVSRATGHEPVTFQWLWSPHSEHRICLPRIVYLAAGEMVGHNPRALAAVTNLVVCAVTAGLLLAVRRWRGDYRWTDLVIPALLLHWGHEINLTWPFNQPVTLTSCLALGALAIIAGARHPVSSGTALLMVLALLLAASCGLYGLIYTPAVALWLLVEGWRQRRTTPRRGWAIVGCGLLLAAAAAVGMAATPFTAQRLQSPNLWATLGGFVRFLATGVGPVTNGIGWPALLAVAGLTGWGALLWARACRAALHGELARDDARRLAGLSALGASGLLLATATAYGRAGGGVDDLWQPRYGIMVAPLFCTMYLICRGYGQPLQPRHAAGLLALLAAIVVVNDRKAVRDGRKRLAWMQQVVAEARAGVSDEEIATRWSVRLQCGPADLARHLGQLREARHAPFDGPAMGAASQTAATRAPVER